MTDYEVIVSDDGLIIKGKFSPDSIPVEIPDDDPNRKYYIDLFLHKADIERGIEFLKHMSKELDEIINEGLFIAALNNCMKCFKYSRARSSLDKTIVFKGNDEFNSNFQELEKMRDKHFDHDENGMLQALAFLLVRPDENNKFGGPPSVVWNKTIIDYFIYGEKLLNIMIYIKVFIEKEIDRVGDLILNTYLKYSSKELCNFKKSKMIKASIEAKRKL